jgi:DNA invertase Pin-like site-specific DNA recombinase
MSEKLTSTHLQRAAYVYVRQSSLHQVQQHRESQRQQYALAERARALGFAQVVIIDEDLGRSGSGKVERPGFGRLLEAVCAGEVGAVLALEASRLARNNRDWHHLVDLCALTGTLVLDYDGIYDPRQLNDRLLLGLKGTMSEFELGLLRQRAQEALRAMIRRGDVLTAVPVGYERTRDHRCELTPDLQVQEAIRGLFAKFREFGSARQVLLWYRAEKIPLPVRTEGGSITWRLPGYPRVLSVLRNPCYAGAFVYGRTGSRTVVVEGRAQITRGHTLPREQWSVVLRDHHASYISWSQYIRNQEQLERNAAMRGLMTGAGAARRGAALLAGLLRCGRCGRKLHVSYSGANGRVPRYHCKGAQINHGAPWCISFGGLRVDEVVGAEVVKALSPLGLEAALSAWAGRQSEEDERVRALRRALEKARYEAERARRQYDGVEPENRLVAAELERRWNERLAEQHDLEQRLEAIEKAECAPAESERKRLLELGQDLPALWSHPQAPMVLKKRILRTVLEEIVADVEEDGKPMRLRLHWKGGSHTSIAVPRNKRGHHRRCTERSIIELLPELAKVSPDAQIARVLNRLGYRTGQDNPWNESRVRTLRVRLSIPAFDRGVTRSWVTLEEAGERLEISVTAVRRLLRDGVLEGQQVVRHAPWVIPAAALQRAAVQTAARAARQGRRRPRTVPGQREIPFESTL